MNPTKPVLFLVGPTASGKSRIAVDLARHLDGEIISADSMQVYKGMDIGTAKATKVERREIRHHLLDLIPITRTFSVYEYRKLALRSMEDITRRKKLPMVVGGSGLYIRCLILGLSEQPGQDPKIRKRLEKDAVANGLDSLYGKLCQFDPQSASKIHPRDKKRITRALEICEASGKTPSEWYQRREPLESYGFKPMIFGILKNREELYRAIGQRVDRMFRQGFVREVERLSKKRWSKTAEQAVGYKELLTVIKEGKGRPSQEALEQAKAQIKLNTRHLAKRQMTWFRKEPGIQWISWEKGMSLRQLVKILKNLKKRLTV